MKKLFGYYRVSTLDQNLDTQLDALHKASCDKIFQGKITEKFAKVKKALERSLSVIEIVSLTGICTSSAMRYRNQLDEIIDQSTIYK